MNSGFLNIGSNVIETLLAITAEEQNRGLMFQEWEPPVMSFVYAKPNINKFWMKNTPSPLDIIFSCDGKINQIKKGEPYSTQIIGEDIPSDLIIELPFGTAEKIDIKLGSKVGLIKPTLAEIRYLLRKHGV